MDINLTYNEQRALLEFLKTQLIKDNNESYDSIDGYSLLTAYNKLQLTIDKREYLDGFSD